MAKGLPRAKETTLEVHSEHLALNSGLEANDIPVHHIKGEEEPLPLFRDVDCQGVIYLRAVESHPRRHAGCDTHKKPGVCPAIGQSKRQPITQPGHTGPDLVEE